MNSLRHDRYRCDTIATGDMLCIDDSISLPGVMLMLMLAIDLNSVRPSSLHPGTVRHLRHRLVQIN